MKSYKKPFSAFTVSLAIFLNFSLTPALQALSITDIKDVSPKDPRVGMFIDLIENGAFSLDRRGDFRPAEAISRAAFLKASLSYLGFKPVKTLNSFTGYSDVPENSWFAPYVKKALEIRALTNNLNDRFYPEQSLTRQEGLLLIMRIYGLPIPLTAPDSSELYSDIRPNHPLASVYAAAKSHYLYFEKDQEAFRPNLLLTRGDAADLLFKAKIASQLLTPNDHPYGSVTISVSSPSPVDDSQTDLLENEKFGILLDTWSKINTQFVYTEKVSQDKLVYGAIGGMVDSLDDAYSTFNSPDADGSSYIYIPEDYEGIGAVIEQTDGNFIILTTLNNSPAYRAGLKSKDIIQEIDGKSLTGLTYEQVTSLIKGRAGTTVKLKIKRDSTLLNFEIVREKITIEALQWKTVGNNINYLRIDQFTESSGQEFADYLVEMQKAGSKKLIVDLRNNPGGYLTSTQDILGHFLTDGQVEFYTVDRNNNRTQYLSNGLGELKDYQVVVLVNEGSASASEIFAGALQDYQLAHLIGNTTFGKGSVQEITNYSDNSSLKLTIAKWLTPKLRDINHVGLVPDQSVTISDQQKQLGLDPQLTAAIQYLN